MIRDVGDRVDVRYEARSPDGALTNATVTLTVTDPAGNTTAPSVTNTATGVYDASFTLTAAGTWQWKWTSTGNVVDVAYGQVTAQDASPPTYASLAQLRAELNLHAGNTSHDPGLLRALNTASRAVEAWCDGRKFYLERTATQRLFRFDRWAIWDRCRGQWRLPVDDIGHATYTVETSSDGSTWVTLTEGVHFEPYPDNALAKLEPITHLVADEWPARIRVTARWGWPAVPSQVEEATLRTAARAYRRKDSPDGVAGSSDWGLIRVPNLDPDVRQMLSIFHTDAMIA